MNWIQKSNDLLRSYAETLDRRDIPPMNEIETGMREAALRDGSKALSVLLSEMPDHGVEGVLCNICSSQMDIIGRRDKNIISLLGEGVLSRMYYECTNKTYASHRFPKDESLDISNTSFSPGVRRLMAKSGSNSAFEKGSIDLEEFSCIRVSAKDVERISEKIGNEIKEWKKTEIGDILEKDMSAPAIKSIPVMYVEFDGTGVPVITKEVIGRIGKQEGESAKTREVKVGCVFTQTTTDDKGRPIRDINSTSYVAEIETAEEFGKRIEAEAIRRGMFNAKILVIIGDGAVWIRNIVEERFCGAMHIVDFYHGKDHLYKLMRLLFLTDDEMKEHENEWIHWFKEENIEEIINSAKQFCDTSSQISADVKKEINYFIENASRMKYAEYRAMGLFLGSGVIEASCKNVIGKRLKQSGMRWSVKGANDIIALRCCIQSDRFDEYWEKRCAK